MAHELSLNYPDDDTVEAYCSCGWFEGGFEDEGSAEMQFENHVAEEGLEGGDGWKWNGD